MCGIDKVLTIHAHGGVNLVSMKSKRLESRVDCVFLPAAPCLAKRNGCGNLPCSMEGVTSELD